MEDLSADMMITVIPIIPIIVVEYLSTEQSYSSSRSCPLSRGVHIDSLTGNPGAPGNSDWLFSSASVVLRRRGYFRHVVQVGAPR
jgi:hypothetical protein